MQAPSQPSDLAPSLARPGARAGVARQGFRSLPHPAGWPILGQLPGFDAADRKSVV